MAPVGDIAWIVGVMRTRISPELGRLPNIVAVTWYGPIPWAERTVAYHVPGTGFSISHTA
jgi:hypothetical protein